VTLTFRHTKSCHLCAAAPRLCEMVRKDIGGAVRHVNDLEAFTEARAPNGEVTFNCDSFTPKRQKVR
jgi:hypothetical protein